MLSLTRIPHSFVLLIAPPASGKTSMLLNLFEQSKHLQWVFVSPLRALADEFQARLEKELINKESIWVLTAEKLYKKKYEFLFLSSQTIFIFDEIHLIYRWGFSFRQRLLEIWFKACCSQAHVWGLTATLSIELKRELARDIRNNFNADFFIDCDNFTFKTKPKKQVRLPIKGSSWEHLIMREILDISVVSLIFVPYRHQVDEWLDFAKGYGVCVLGCKGGEVADFREKLLEKWEQVSTIISTSCLSHGVNLPSIDNILITYPVDETFWLQMATRGGRRGEDYSVYSCREPFQLSSRRLQEFMGFLFALLHIKISLWYLREYWFLKNLIRRGT